MYFKVGNKIQSQVKIVLIPVMGFQKEQINRSIRKRFNLAIRFLGIGFIRIFHSWISLAELLEFVATRERETI